MYVLGLIHAAPLIIVLVRLTYIIKHPCCPRDIATTTTIIMQQKWFGNGLKLTTRALPHPHGSDNDNNNNDDDNNETGRNNAIAWLIHDTLALHMTTALDNQQNKHIQEHTCGKDCDMEELDIQYEYNACSKSVTFIVNPLFPLETSCSLNMQRFNGLFMCPASGKLHLCGSGRCTLCGGHGVCEDGSYVCLLTGIIVDSGEWVGKTWQQDDLDKGSGEHLSWKTDKQHSKKEAQEEKLWNTQFDSLCSELYSFRTLLCELLPGGKHSQRIHAKINSTIVKRCTLRILNCIKKGILSSKKNTANAVAANVTIGSGGRPRLHSIDIMRIKQLIMTAVRKCYIECNGLRVMCVTAQQRRSIANAYTASIFNLYNEMSTSKWVRVKGNSGHGAIGDGVDSNFVMNNKSTTMEAPPKRTMRFVQFGFNVLMLSQSGLCFNNNQVIKEDSFLKSALPCVHHIMKDDKLLSEHPYIKYMAKSTKRMIAMFKMKSQLPFMEPVDARASACSHTELNFCAEGFHGNRQQFSM